MKTQAGLTYTETFADIANWANGFTSGTGASAFKAVAVNATGTIPDGVKTTVTTATLLAGNSSSTGLQKGTGTLQFLTTGSTAENSAAIAVDFLLDFTDVNAGTISFDWAAITNSTGNRFGSLRVYTSTDGTTFTELTAADVLDKANGSSATGSITTVQLPSSFNGSASAVIRFYETNGTNTTTTGISGSRPKITVDNLTVTATSTSGGDTTPPVNATNYPNVSNPTSTTVAVASKLDEIGTTYYVVLPAANTPPSAAQVKAGQDASSAAAANKGSLAITAANTEATGSITGLTAASAYKVYFVSADATGNLQASVTSASVTTTAAADVTPPVNAATYPKTGNATTTSVDVTTNLNEAGTAYYVLIPATGTAPTTVAQVKAGQDGTGAAAFKSGSFAVTASTDATTTISGLTASTAYNIYVVSQDAAATPNLQAAFSTLNISTSAAAGGGATFTASYPFTGVTTTPATGTTDPTAVPTATGVTFGSFTATGTPTNPNAAGRFSFTAWPTGATTGINTFTGVINTAEYYEVTVTPQAGNTVSLTSIDFVSQRSSTGPRQYVVRSSLDGFAANLPASISPANTALSVVSTNVFQADDATVNTATPLAGNTITLDGSYASLTTPVTFRFYAYNSEAAGGSFSIDNVNINGSSATVAAAPPVISSSLAASSTYGTAITTYNISASNAPASFTASNLPPGLAVNTTTGQITGTPTSVTGSPYSVTITATNTYGTDTKTLVFTVNQQALTIAGLTANNKVFDGTTTATLSGTPSLTGVVGTDDVTLTGTPIATFADAVAANDKPVTVTGYTLGGTAAGNYSLTQPTGLTANITTSNLTSQTITFDQPTPVTYGDASFTLAAIASSGLAVSYTSSNTSVATVTGSTVTVVGAGTTTITANQAGDGTFDVAPAVQQTLTVQPKVLTITADDKFRFFGAANPAFTVVYTGFVGTETTANLTTLATATTTATAASLPNNYDIVPAGASAANYSFNYVKGKLIVAYATRLITFTGIAGKTYGDADFAPGATISSGETVNYASSNTSVATVVSGKIHIVGAGIAVITASAPVNTNYGNSPDVSQLLTVNKANQTITFAAIPNINEGASYSLAAVTSSTGLPVTYTVSDKFMASITGTTLHANGLGTVTVTATAAADANYNSVSATQTVKIVDANGADIIVRQAVSPNGDGINDFLYIEGVKAHPINKLTVVNRNGVKIFEIHDYDNAARVFDGHSNVTGKLQQAGTYFYVLELNDGGKVNRQTGYFLVKYQD